MKKILKIVFKSEELIKIMYGSLTQFKPAITICTLLASGFVEYTQAMDIETCMDKEINNTQFDDRKQNSFIPKNTIMSLDNFYKKSDFSRPYA